MVKEYGVRLKIYELEDFFGKEAIRSAFEIIEKYKEKGSHNLFKDLVASLCHAIFYEKRFKEYYLGDKDYILKLVLAIEIHNLLRKNRRLYKKLKEFYFKY